MKKALRYISLCVATLSFFGLTAVAVDPADQIAWTLSCLGLLCLSSKVFEKLDGEEEK